MSALFPYRFDRVSRKLLRLMLVRPMVDVVRLDASGLHATLGPLSFSTPMGNIESFDVTGPYQWLRAVGPRISLKDHGLTFGTNADRGVCVQFREPIDPVIGPWHHPAVTMTVEDPLLLVRALNARSVTEDHPREHQD